ncbi:MAG: M1 family metallopeptidase [Microscillaceae bacterium]
MVLAFAAAQAQTPKPPYKSSKFAQLEQELPTPNVYRAANGAPGPEYWQQRADYFIKVELFEETQMVQGSETITYYNNSPIELDYLWLQLDQNRFSKDSDTYATETGELSTDNIGGLYTQAIIDQAGLGYQILSVKDEKGNPLPYTINKTMMRVDLPSPIKAKGGKFTFSVEWKNRERERLKVGGRGGFEYFPGDGNCVYSLAQWFPRMCVFDDVDGWQNKQFLGRGEFALPFGDYEVHITVPEDHILAATGELQNPQEVLSPTQLQRWKQAETATEPVVIVSQAEAIANEKDKSSKKKTWIHKAQNVRDFAWASSRKFIWDAMRVDVGGKKVWAMSYYPKEANPLWGDYSTHLVALTLKEYSKRTFDYPYPVAISVEASNGMEYPMICYNYGRPNPDGTVNPRIKDGMFGVIIHEVGHNYFPMIVNSDERQWTWMDEGLNTFLEYLTELEISNTPWGKKAYPEGYPATRGNPKYITPYMRLGSEQLVPIMTNSESILNFGPNAYTKPATGLNILRNTIMGPELFDYAFKQYARRWMFKHPHPADFFRTMEDASAVDLDWFWRGWFYTTEPCDISLEKVTLFQMPDKKGKILADEEKAPFEIKKFDLAKISEANANRRGPALSKEEMALVNPEQFYYQLDFKNVGGLLMPVIFQINYKDGSQEIVKIPAEIWRLNPEQVSKVIKTNKEVASFLLDPNEETADIDLSNNQFPRPEEQSSSQFDEFKKKQKP